MSLPYEPDVLSLSDIARKLGVTRERVRQLAKEPGFPPHHMQVGRMRYWRPKDIDQWIAEHRPGQSKKAATT